MLFIVQPRSLFMLLSAAACVGINICLGMTGHYRLPLFVFIAYMAVTGVIVRKLPRPTGLMCTHELLLTFSSILRFIGFVLALGCLIAIFSTPFLKNPLPLWALIPILLWWALWVWGSFWGAKWIKNKALELKQPAPGAKMRH